MKKIGVLLSGLVLLTSSFFIGCSSDNSSSPTSIPAQGTASIEGQLVADAESTDAKSSLTLLQNASDAPGPVYPIYGATVELMKDGIVVATTTTDEYGRFQFNGLAAGDYDVRVVSDGEAIAHYHIYVNPDQTLTMYGRVVAGDCRWDQETGPHWDDMSQGPHWGEGFQGASPGQGYRHDGQQWCDPQGSGPHGPGGPRS